MHARQLIGLDLGGTKCALGVETAVGGFAEVARFPTAGPAETLARFAAEIGTLPFAAERSFGVTGNAGEVGHLRLAPDGPVGYGKAGSFEGFCSGGGMAQLARRRVAEFRGASALQAIPIPQLGAREVGAAAEAGDELALALWR